MPLTTHSVEASLAASNSKHSHGVE